eukprot:495422-Amphidinium_carterae.2
MLCLDHSHPDRLLVKQGKIGGDKHIELAKAGDKLHDQSCLLWYTQTLESLEDQRSQSQSWHQGRAKRRRRPWSQVQNNFSNKASVRQANNNPCQRRLHKRHLKFCKPAKAGHGPQPTGGPVTNEVDEGSYSRP